MLKLDPNPKFKAKVFIPVAGEKPVGVTLHFKHMKRDDAFALMRAVEDGTKNAVAAIMEVAEGWDEVDAAFTVESVERMHQVHAGAARAVFEGYQEALLGRRLGN
jgi:hypothetical protein